MDRFEQLARGWDLAPMHVERTRDVAAMLRGRLPLPLARGLEVGAGTGLLSLALAGEIGSIVAADPSPGMLDVLRVKIEAARMPNISAVLAGDDLAGVDGAFDVVLLQMALHHVADVPGFLGRAFARLLPGGWIAIADLDSEDGSFHGPEVKDVHLGFGRDEIAGRARDAGFVQVRIETAHVMRRGAGASRREYPVFLLVARRPLPPS